MLLDHYQHQTTNNFEKLLEQEDEKNTSKVTTPIFLTIGMHIRPTRLLEVISPNIKYDSEGRLYEGCTYANLGDKSEIKAMVADNNEDDDDKDSYDKTRQLKKNKQ